MRIGYKYHTILGQLAILHFKRNMFDWSVESAALLSQLRFSCLIVSSHKQLDNRLLYVLVSSIAEYFFSLLVFLR